MKKRYWVLMNLSGVCFVFDRAHGDRLVWSGARLSAAIRERDRLNGEAA